MIVNPIKQSASTDSLTGLNGVCDTACHFCTEPADIENSRKLVDSKLFSSCQCRYATHIDCWQTYMDMATEKKFECPLCKMVLQSWKIKEAGFELAAANAKKRCEYWNLYAVVFVIVAILIFVGLLVGLSKH